MSTPVLQFYNYGKLDPRLITTFGASVKESSNPFGRFGTGIKYGIAGVLRLGGTISIKSGSEHWEFFTQQEEIRGKEFTTVWLRWLAGEYKENSPPQACGFTTELGKHWMPWMVYREFYCNALDERGGVMLCSGISANGETAIFIDCPDLLKVHLNREEHFIPKNALAVAATNDLEVFDRPSTHIYYQGVCVADLEKPAKFTYNLLGDVFLTEDRVLSGTYVIHSRLSQALLDGKLPRSIAIQILTAPENESLEGKIDINSYSWGPPSEGFLSITREIMATKSAHLNRSALTVLYKAVPKETISREVHPSVDQASLIEAAKLACSRAGVIITAPIHIAAALGTDVLSTVFDGEIWLSTATFIAGPNAVATALLSEQLRITHGFLPMTRLFETFLLELVINLSTQLGVERNARQEQIEEIPHTS